MGGRGSSSGRAGGTLKSNITHPELAKDDKFFGKTQYYSNKYFSYDSVIDKDNIIVRTNNVKMIKGNPVLIVDNDKGIYLKDWQVAPIKMDRGETNTYAVKLNRNYMKEYTFKSNFEDFSFSKKDDFNSLMKVARSQQKQNKQVSHGWGYGQQPFKN